MKPIAPADTPLARRFAAALADTSPQRKRIALNDYTAAFLRAEPSLVTAPERRNRLSAALDELVEAGVITVSKKVERSEKPALPRFVVLLNRVPDPPVGLEAARYPWRPELAWAAKLPLRRSEFDALRAVQVFLRDRENATPVVPVGERSLDIFGDEKRLDDLRHNRRLFGAGRLSWDLLRARVYAPPFAFKRLGDGSVALVLENVATYRSVLATLPSASPVGVVVFGGGSNFAASVGYFSELAKEGAGSITEIRYFGDLDRRGLEIPIAANATAMAAGLPTVRPAIGLWAKLLRVGRRAPYGSVDPAIATRLVKWLPASLRSAAQDVLTASSRLAQEAVGSEVLAADPSWASWAQLGPPGVERPNDPPLDLRRRSATVLRRAEHPIGDAALVRDDFGAFKDPTSDSEWSDWVAAAHTRNWVLGDPLLDWLRLHGRSAGFLRDDERSGYDPRTDFRKFVLEKGMAFEAAVNRLLKSRTSVVQIAYLKEDARSLPKALATLQALRAGIPIVAQGVLRNPAARAHGVVDLLVRSDLLASWFPEMLSMEEASMGAPGLGQAHFHYRPVEIKFHSFDLTADGHVGASPEQLAYAVQTWLYLDALGRIQGYLPPAGYLMGRSWQQADYRGDGCLERLARVDLDRWIGSRDTSLEDLARQSAAWIRRVRVDGADWRILPEPSVPELYPHARNADDAPWHAAKREIATSLAELTLLPAMNPERRASAHAAGIRRWSDEAASATALGVTSTTYATRLDAVLAANRASPGTVLPSRVNTEGWRSSAALEFYVDFETVSNLEDDFSQLPAVAGTPLIVQIGCGHLRDGEWKFAQWTVDYLRPAAEREIIDAWLNHITETCASTAVQLPDARIFHWSAAEPVNLETAYMAARTRHPEGQWPSPLPWLDFLERVVRAEPVAVTGAFNFGLKAIAKAMHTLGLISTVWSDGPTDGLGAMVGIWSAAREASATGTSLSKHPLMREIARYNEVDCRVMCEVIAWLRQNR